METITVKLINRTQKNYLRHLHKPYWIQNAVCWLRWLLKHNNVSPCFIIMSRTSFRVNPHRIVYLNVKKLLARSRCHIWSLTDSNEFRTHNHLVRKRTLKYFAKLAKWLSFVVSTYLYGAFDCMLLSCHVRVSEWILTVQISPFVKRWTYF